MMDLINNIGRLSNEAWPQRPLLSSSKLDEGREKLSTNAEATGPSGDNDRLVSRIQARDPEGWRILLDLYGPVIHSWCRRAGLQYEDIADVAQDVFCSLMRRVPQFRQHHNEALRSWIWTITQNKLRDYFRRQARLPMTGGETLHHLLQIPQQERGESATPRQQSELFHRVLLLLRSEFEERTWMAFWRSVIDEQESTTIGQDLDMTPNAVRKAKSRVLRRLREQLEKMK